jgi:predicted RNA-binding protein with PIN domain
VRWIVDGMNVIGSRPDGWWRDREGARRRFVDVLADYQVERRRSGGAADQIVVVFDGRGMADEIPRGAELGVAVVFAPGGPNAADHVIADMARSCTDPAATTVVTSDAALAREVRDAGVPVVGVGAFSAMVATRPT